MRSEDTIVMSHSSETSFQAALLTRSRTFFGMQHPHLTLSVNNSRAMCLPMRPRGTMKWSSLTVRIVIGAILPLQVASFVIFLLVGGDDPIGAAAGFTSALAIVAYLCVRSKPKLPTTASLERGTLCPAAHGCACHRAAPVECLLAAGYADTLPSTLSHPTI
jgi:hypothetical protein